MKITVNEARTDVTLKVGPVRIRVQGAYSYQGNKARVIVVPMEATCVLPGNDAWGFDAYAHADMLKGNKLEAYLTEHVRQLAGDVLGSTKLDDIGKRKYSLSVFAGWEEGMLADSAGMAALKAEIKKRIDNFKEE